MRRSLLHALQLVSVWVVTIAVGELPAQDDPPRSTATDAIAERLAEAELQELALGDYAQAVRIYEELLALEEVSDDLRGRVLLRLGRAQRLAGLANEARTTFERVAAEYPRYSGSAAASIAELDAADPAGAVERDWRLELRRDGALVAQIAGLVARLGVDATAIEHLERLGLLAAPVVSAMARLSTDDVVRTRAASLLFQWGDAGQGELALRSREEVERLARWVSGADAATRARFLERLAAVEDVRPEARSWLELAAGGETSRVENLRAVLAARPPFEASVRAVFGRLLCDEEGASALVAQTLGRQEFFFPVYDLSGNRGRPDTAHPPAYVLDVVEAVFEAPHSIQELVVEHTAPRFLWIYPFVEGVEKDEAIRKYWIPSQRLDSTIWKIRGSASLYRAIARRTDDDELLELATQKILQRVRSHPEETPIARAWLASAAPGPFLAAVRYEFRSEWSDLRDAVCRRFVALLADDSPAAHSSLSVAARAISRGGGIGSWLREASPEVQAEAVAVLLEGSIRRAQGRGVSLDDPWAPVERDATWEAIHELVRSLTEPWALTHGTDGLRFLRIEQQPVLSAPGSSSWSAERRADLLRVVELACDPAAEATSRREAVLFLAWYFETYASDSNDELLEPYRAPLRAAVFDHGLAPGLRWIAMVLAAGLEGTIINRSRQGQTEVVLDEAAALIPLLEASDPVLERYIFEVAWTLAATVPESKRSLLFEAYAASKRPLLRAFAADPIAAWTLREELGGSKCYRPSQEQWSWLLTLFGQGDGNTVRRRRVSRVEDLERTPAEHAVPLSVDERARLARGLLDDAHPLVALAAGEALLGLRDRDGALAILRRPRPTRPAVELAVRAARLLEELEAKPEEDP